MSTQVESVVENTNIKVIKVTEVGNNKQTDEDIVDKALYIKTITNEKANNVKRIADLTTRNTEIDSILSDINAL